MFGRSFRDMQHGNWPHSYIAFEWLVDVYHSMFMIMPSSRQAWIRRNQPPSSLDRTYAFVYKPRLICIYIFIVFNVHEMLILTKHMERNFLISWIYCIDLGQHQLHFSTRPRHLHFIKEAWSYFSNKTWNSCLAMILVLPIWVTYVEYLCYYLDTQKDLSLAHLCYYLDTQKDLSLTCTWCPAKCKAVGNRWGQEKTITQFLVLMTGIELRWANNSMDSL